MFRYILNLKSTQILPLDLLMSYLDICYVPFSRCFLLLLKLKFPKLKLRNVKTNKYLSYMYYTYVLILFISFCINITGMVYYVTQLDSRKLYSYKNLFLMPIINSPSCLILSYIVRENEYIKKGSNYTTLSIFYNLLLVSENQSDLGNNSKKLRRLSCTRKLSFVRE